jgi:hypothetical protein
MKAASKKQTRKKAKKAKRAGKKAGKQLARRKASRKKASSRQSAKRRSRARTAKGTAARSKRKPRAKARSTRGARAIPMAGVFSRGVMPREELTPNLCNDPVEGKGTRGATRAAPSWRVAKCLLALRDQLNRKTPSRDKVSDGTIGDPSHQARTSDHNPWVRDGAVGVVTAMDVTHNRVRGIDAGVLAEAIRTSRDPRVKYIIWNSQIASSAPTNGAAPWAWRPYSGSNKHTHHVHISVKPEKASYDSEAPWRV